MLQKFLKVAIDTPLDTTFDYRWKQPTTESPLPQVGQLLEGLHLPCQVVQADGVRASRALTDLEESEVVVVLRALGLQEERLIAHRGAHPEPEHTGVEVA